METTLAGQDGKSPAIDQATGQPLTIEDLLRRRGLLAVNGATRINGQAPGLPVATTAQGQGTNPLAAVMAARNGGAVPIAASSGASPAVVASTSPQAQGVPANVPSGNPLTVGDPNGSVLPDPNVLAPLAVGGAAGLGWALASRRKKSKGAGPAGLDGGGGTSPKPGAMANTGNRPEAMPGTAPTNNTAVRQSGMIEGTRQLPSPAVDAEFTEVNPLVKLLTDKRVLKALTRVHP